MRSVMLTVAVHPPVRLSEPRLLSSGGVAMKLEGMTNRVYSIVVTSDLVDWLSNWTSLLRFTNTGGETIFTDTPPASAPQRFYRAKEEP